MSTPYAGPYGTFSQTTNVETATVSSSQLNSLYKEYLTYDVLMKEVVDRSYVLQKVNKKNGWKGGPIPVPFEAAEASSFRMGSLIAQDSITETKYVRGLVENYKEIWGALKFNYHDLQKTGDLKQSFAQSILKELPRFAETLKTLISHFLLNGPDITKITDITDAATGIVKVARPELLKIGQYVEIGGATKKKGVYVGAININTFEVTCVTAITDVDALTNPVDLTAATAVIVGDTFRIEDGFNSDLQFTSLPQQLLSAANGGLATHFGKSKARYPFLQAYNHNGSAIAAGNILTTIFDAWARCQAIGANANVDSIMMSYRNLSWAMKELEAGGGAGGIGKGRQFTAGDRKVSAYGWSEIKVMGINGKELTLVGINEMRDDYIIGCDWRYVDLHTNGMVERVTSPDGNEFYTVRAENGYYFISDVRFFGELVVSMPSYQFIIHGIV